MGQYDFSINSASAINWVTPLNERAVAWVAANLKVEDWQYMGASFGVEARLVNDLITKLEAASFNLEIL